MRVRVDPYLQGDIAIASGAIPRSPIEEEADDRLRPWGYLALGTSNVRSARVSSLRGRLPSHHLNQVPQAKFAEIEGVVVVKNEFQAKASGNDSTIRRDASDPTESSTEAQAEPTREGATNDAGFRPQG